MKNYILGLIEKKERLYQENYHEMLGDYNRELETVKGYNGRQLLELIQNCDDELATEVSIILDQKYKTISINNNGKPFSKKGYRSLFIANLSAKTSKRKYIGNKGLGFRSIINWSNAIEIKSNNLSLLYSEANRHQNFLSLFGSKIRQKIREEENFKKNFSPVPFLTLPKVRDIEQEQFVTSIVIHYQENFYDDIIQQVKNIAPTTLLFLKNIEQIKFKGFEGVDDLNLDDIICTREKLSRNSSFFPDEKIKFNKNSWYIFSEENDLPVEFSDSDRDEEEFYQIKIAVEKDFEETSPYLHSFFPTNIPFDQPYILHATFDLDSTRNQVNDSRKNRFLLEKIVEFTIEVAKYYVGQKVNYKPLEILKHDNPAGTLQKLGYYELIEQALYSQNIFPCIDNTYKRFEEVIYINDDFAQLLQELEAGEILNCHLIPAAEDALVEYLIEEIEVDNDLDNVENIAEVLNEISTLPMSFEQRADLIKTIIEECEFLLQEEEHQMNFLLNDKGEIIQGTEYIYTPITKNNELKTPSFTNIQFINKKLLEALILSLDFENSETPHKSRFIYDQLKGFTNIHSYEPATLAQKIVSETNNQIKKNSQLAKHYVQEMHRCLFYNFSQLDEETRNSDLRFSVPVITKNGEIKESNQVVLSSHYPKGKITEIIFKGIYEDDVYISSPQDLGLEEDSDSQEMEEYLKWIQVNTFAKYRLKTAVNEGLNDYANFVQKRKDLGPRKGYQIRYTFIEGVEGILDTISLNKLLIWIYFDHNLKIQLYDGENTDSYIYSYYGPNNTRTKPSYLKYKFITYYKLNFEDYLLEEKYSWVNDFQIDYSHPLFIQFGITKSMINEILVVLGAKDRFEDLSIERVTAILNLLPYKFKDGKKSLTFYKKALSHYRENKTKLSGPVTLFADNGTRLEAYQQDQVYFSDRIKLPIHLKSFFPIFNFPSRSGGVEAISFFEINDLREININLQEYKLCPNITQDFHRKLERLRPLILSQRISSIDEAKPQKLQASICNKIEIHLCSSIKYEVEDESYFVSDYEYIHEKEYTYYVKVKSEDTIDSLFKISAFTDSIADILTLSFDVPGEKNAFRWLLRSHFEDALNSIVNDYGEDTLQEARTLLGLADFKQAFWEAIFISKGVHYEEQLDDHTMEQFLSKKLNISFDVNSINYEKLNVAEEEIKVKTLFSLLGLTPVEFNLNYIYDFNLHRTHFNSIKNLILGRKNRIKSAVWKNLYHGNLEDKADYLSLINQYEDFEEFAKEKAEELKYDFDLDLEAIWEEYIHLLYGDINFESNLDLQSQKQENLERFTAEQKYEIQQSERFRSLIYFDNVLDIIEKEIENEKKSQEVEIQLEPVSSSSAISSRQTRVLNSEILKPKSTTSIRRKKRKVFVPSEKGDKKLKEKGNSSEDEVFTHLKRNFSNVDKVSEDNEGLHYDIRYTNDEGIVKFVEVKTFENGRFFLSKAEYDFGLEHKVDYEIWLVTECKDLIPIYDFFENPKYNPIISEYLIYLDSK